MGLLDFLFRRNAGETTNASPEQIQQEFTEALRSGSARQLLKTCKKHRARIDELFEDRRKIPEEIRNDPAAVEQYIAGLVAIAQCYAQQLKHTGPMERLTNREGSPMQKWEQTVRKSCELIENTQYAEAIDVLQRGLDSTKGNRGTAVDFYTAVFNGRIGECLFNSGKVADAVGRTQTALDICRGSGDVEGIAAYLSYLIEMHRYLANTETAAAFADQLAEQYDQHGKSTEAETIRNRARRIRAGEPLNRVMVRTGDERFELDELKTFSDGRFRFEFERNRMSIELSVALCNKGKDLGAKGAYADALDLFRNASEVDPYDPDPAYQAGVALMDMGCHDEAHKYFQEVERLAPGWFQCRTNAWMADAIASGRLDPATWETCRMLEDGDLDPKQIVKLCEQFIKRMDDFAPIWLAYGSALSRLNRQAEALTALRRGLSCCEEPDVETRLRVQLAIVLPDGPERSEQIECAIAANGNLVAAATAHLMQARPT